MTALRLEPTAEIGVFELGFASDMIAEASAAVIGCDIALAADRLARAGMLLNGAIGKLEAVTGLYLCREAYGWRGADKPMGEPIASEPESDTREFQAQAMNLCPRCLLRRDAFPPAGCGEPWFHNLIPEVRNHPADASDKP